MDQILGPPKAPATNDLPHSRPARIITQGHHDDPDRCSGSPTRGAPQLVCISGRRRADCSVGTAPIVATRGVMILSIRRDNELVRIRAARVAELPVLQQIEQAAGQIFCDIGMPEIAQYEPWPLPVLAAIYARCGLRVLDEAELTPGLRAIRHREAELGLDRWSRVCMRRPRLDFRRAFTSGCAGTQRSAAGTRESSDCGSRRRGSRSPGGWSGRGPRRRARPSRSAGAGSAPR